MLYDVFCVCVCVCLFLLTVLGCRVCELSCDDACLIPGVLLCLCV